ncbi:uncharacterized protein LOC106167718 [Lingula anatina]|uniref:Uncharacterized protein LOC106167718 n=1 Tax=Lingula anatina TaxID=7574 RepID=A0A1S3IVN3_LINAN|nr:uncharacterized protein LOC106167718 [Lingula anatina]|eukprot:XP_013402026.1 uncharacterized protein LOC106167718 [Lingula anatina]
MFSLCIAAVAVLVSLNLVHAQETGTFVRLRSQNEPDYTWGLHSNGDAYIMKGFSGNFFRIVPGLSGQPDTVSFNSVDYPSSYLRHHGFLVSLESSKNPRNGHMFVKDATFYPRPDKFLQGYTAYESVNYPGHFIRHAGHRLEIRRYDGSLLFKRDASFKVEPIELLEKCDSLIPTRHMARAETFGARPNKIPYSVKLFME